MNDQNKNFQEEYQKGRNTAMTMASFVYIGVVVAATVLFITFILQAFPDSAYFTRFIMGIAGLLVGGSMLAFPVTLHNWAVSGNHRRVAIGLYYGEMFIIGLNTIVSFTALLFKYAGAAMPDWVAWYEPFSILSIIYTLFAWGTIYLTDPHVKAKAMEKEALDQFAVETANMMKSYLHSDDGKQAIQEAANKKIAENFQTKPDGPNPWIKPQHQARLPQATEPPVNNNHPRRFEQPAAAPRMTCLYCGNPSGTLAFCSDEHEVAYAKRVLAGWQETIGGSNGSRPNA